MAQRLHFDQGTLVVEGCPPALAATLGLVADDRIGHHRALAHTYRRVFAGLVREGLTPEDDARRYQEIALEMPGAPSPRAHQSEALEAWKAAGKRGVVVLPTGSGKSHLARMAMVATGRNTLVVVPTLDLMAQWAGQLEEAFGITVGLLGGGEHRVEEVTVATYDSAALHMERLGNRFGLLVFDEVHHLPGNLYRQAALASLAPFRLGLTATLERSDGRHRDLEDWVGPVVYARTIRDLSGGVLAEYDVVTREVPMDPEDAARYAEARQTYRSFVESNGIRMGGVQGWQRFLYLSSRSPEGRRAWKAYQLQRALALGHAAKLRELNELLQTHTEDRALVFTNDNATVYAISERWLVPCITHETGVEERREILERFREGRYRVIATSRVLNEGVDVPQAAVAIVMSGTATVREHVQRLGRILRPAPGKRATLYELVTAETMETFVNERRRDHDAYK